VEEVLYRGHLIERVFSLSVRMLVAPRTSWPGLHRRASRVLWTRPTLNAAVLSTALAVRARALGLASVPGHQHETTIRKLSWGATYGFRLRAGVGGRRGCGGNETRVTFKRSRGPYRSTTATVASQVSVTSMNDCDPAYNGVRAATSPA
jgi:hypothetical protein